MLRCFHFGLVPLINWFWNISHSPSQRLKQMNLEYLTITRKLSFQIVICAPLNSGFFCTLSQAVDLARKAKACSPPGTGNTGVRGSDRSHTSYWFIKSEDWEGRQCWNTPTITLNGWQEKSGAGGTAETPCVAQSWEPCAPQKVTLPTGEDCTKAPSVGGKARAAEDGKWTSTRRRWSLVSRTGVPLKVQGTSNDFTKAFLFCWSAVPIVSPTHSHFQVGVNMQTTSIGFHSLTVHTHNLCEKSAYKSFHKDIYLSY